MNRPAEHRYPELSDGLPDKAEQALRTPGTDTDELFIRKTLETSPEQGVELLYLRYYQPLCTHAIRFTQSRQVAEDMVSDLFYHFYTQRLYEQITTSYRAYLFKAVRHRGYNYLRWELDRNTPLADHTPVGLPEYQQPDMVTQYEELYHDVENAIGTLPLQRRSIYLKFQFEDKSVKEIAGELLLSPRTVETQLYRARQTIRRLIREKWLLAVLYFLTRF